MAEEFLNKLYEYLINKYPQDNNIRQWFLEYSDKFSRKQKPVLKRTRSVVKKEVKEKLISSYSEERRIEGEIPTNLETVEKCLETLKLLEQSIRSNKRDIIYKSALEGQVINHLKKIRRGNVGVFLAQKGVQFSVSHCYALIRLYKLVELYPNLQKCAVELGLILKNMKTVEEICKELNW